MHDLIKIENTTIGSETTPTINARELHEFLEVRSKFADWISRRIKDYGFLEDKDYTIISQKKETITANNEARVTTLNEYHISLDMAKELAMVERNEKGREARQYFIECEKKLRQVLSSKYNYQLGIINASTEEERMIAFNNYEVGYVQPLEQFKEEALPKVDFYDIAVTSSTTVDIGEAAKILKYKGTGRNNLFKFLRREGVLMKNNAPKQEYVNKGWFKLVEYKVNGEVKVKTLVYQKGLDGIRKMLNEAGLLPEDR